MAGEDKLNTEGREANAAKPLNTADATGGPERYPSTGQDDAVEAGEASRSFDPRADAPAPRQGAGDGGAPASKQDGLTGPEGDPAEGKR